MDFQTSKFLEFVLLNNHYQISKNEENQNFKLSTPAWFLQKLTLKYSPARQADYIDFTGCNQFPKKFCSVRWVEIVEVYKRALEVFKHIKHHISKAKVPNTFTVKTGKKHVLIL